MTTTRSAAHLDALRASLIKLSPAQQAAAESLSSGSTHDEAAQAAGVRRETVSRWSNHHPGFQATLNLYRWSLAMDQADLVRRIRGKALIAIDRQLDDVDVDTAISVLRAIPAPNLGPSDPNAIIDKTVQRTRPRSHQGHR